MKNENDISTSEYIQTFGLMYFRCTNEPTKLIVTSAKCGTRYFTGLCAANIDFVRFHPANDTHEINDKYFNELTDIYWIVRPPFEHLISAIMTEHSSNMDGLENPNKSSSKVQIKKNDDNWILNVLEILLKDLLTEPLFTINTGDKIAGIFTHYKPKYELLFNEIPNRVEIFSKIKFVELKNLSTLIESEFNLNDAFQTKTYAMDRFFTKDSIVDTIKNNFPDMWYELRQIINVEEHYYNKILNYNYNVLFGKKIKQSYKDIDIIYDKLNTELDNAYATLKMYIESHSNYKKNNIKK